MNVVSKVKSTLNSWSKPSTVGKSIASSSVKGAALGGATGMIGYSALKAIQGKPQTGVTVGATGGAVAGANIGAISGAISGSAKYAVGKTAKFFGWTK
jgi:hypothetical protein